MKTDFGSVMAHETPQEVRFKRPAPEQTNENEAVKKARFANAIELLLQAASYSEKLRPMFSEDVRAQENMSPLVENGESSPKSDNGGSPENNDASNSPMSTNSCSNGNTNLSQPEESTSSRNTENSSSNENSMDKDDFNPGIWGGERGWNSCGSSPELSPRRGPSRLPTSIPSTDPVSQIMTTAQDGFNEVSCYCQKPYGGRPMIECSTCKKWIHLSCAKIRKNNIPEEFMCQKCRDAKYTTRKSKRVPRENTWYTS